MKILPPSVWINPGLSVAMAFVCGPTVCSQVSAMAVGGTQLKSPRVVETEFLSASVLKIDFWFRQDEQCGHFSIFSLTSYVIKG